MPLAATIKPTYVPLVVVVALLVYKTVVASFWFDHQTRVCIGHASMCRALGVYVCCVFPDPDKFDWSRMLLGTSKTCSF